MNKKCVCIITGDKYPEGDAGAIRQDNIARIFLNLDYRVVVIGYGSYTGDEYLDYNEVKYTSVRGKSNNTLVRLINRILADRRYKKKILELSETPEIMVVVDAGVNLFKWCMKYAHDNKIQLLHDSVEWYSPEEYKLGKYDPSYIEKNRLNSKIINPTCKIIAISQFLKDYFSKKGINAIRMPVIMDVKNMSYRIEKKESEVTRFVYAGAPALKDNLREILLGYSNLESGLLKRSEFHIIGINKKTLIDKCLVPEECIAKIENSLVIHGRLPHDETTEWVKECDYSILLRRSDLRYAQAGFPTKVVESMALGTPVVCNISSDLGLYLKDEENTITINYFSIEAVTEAMTRAINENQDDRIKMRKSARVTAEANFDYRNYIEMIHTFIDN